MTLSQSLIEWEQCPDKSSYGIKPGLYPLCASNIRVLTALLFECPLSPGKEFIAGAMSTSIGKMYSTGVSKVQTIGMTTEQSNWLFSSAYCDNTDIKFMAWTVWHTWQSKFLIWAKTFAGQLITSCHSLNPMRSCMQEHKQAVIDKHHGWNSLHHPCSGALLNSSANSWVGYFVNEAHTMSGFVDHEHYLVEADQDPTYSNYYLGISFNRQSTIMMAEVISKREHGRCGIVPSIDFDQEHSQGGRGVTAVATRFAQGFVDHKYYIGFNNDYFLDSSFGWVVTYLITTY